MDAGNESFSRKQTLRFVAYEVIYSGQESPTQGVVR